LRLVAAIVLAWLTAHIIIGWASAAHGDVLTLRATGYGSGDIREGCCTGGVISRDGQTWERFDTSTFSLASIRWRRGTEVCLAIPPQADAYDPHMRWSGFITCSYPDGEPLTIADSYGPQFSREYLWNMLDVSHGALRHMGFCRPAEGPYTCLRRWGDHRTVRLYLWAR
jgi:hypothetical protein